MNSLYQDFLCSSRVLSLLSTVFFSESYFLDRLGVCIIGLCSSYVGWIDGFFSNFEKVALVDSSFPVISDILGDSAFQIRNLDFKLVLTSSNLLTFSTDFFDTDLPRL